VASAVDNPTNYFAAANYNDRAQALFSRLDGMSEATQMINTADNGITNIKAFLSQMKGVVNDALSNTDSDERRELGKQFNELIVQVRDMAKDSSYGGINLLCNNAANTVQFGSEVGESTLTLQGFNISSATGAADDSGNLGSSSVLGTSGDGYALSLDLGGSDVVGIMSAGTNGMGNLARLKELASLTASSIALFRSSTELNYDGSSAYHFDDNAANTSAAASLRSLFFKALDIGNAIDGADTYAATATPVSWGTDLVWTSSAAPTIEVAHALDAIRLLAVNADDSSINYGSADLKDQIADAASDDLDALQTYIGAYVSTDTKWSIDWGSGSYQSDLSDVTGQIEDVEGTLKTQSSKLANNLAIITRRQNFTSGEINILKEGADHLTLANLNEEGANLLSLQTSQSLGVRSLSLASQGAANVLSIIQ
jgi:flagellin-like hook-associated protein FlgL